jgi:hypothetical protein
MRSHWRYRLAGLTAAVAMALAVGPAQLAAGAAGHPVAATEQACPQGTHWDDILHACV